MTFRLRHRGKGVVLLVLALLAAACGSTAQQTVQSAGSDVPGATAQSGGLTAPTSTVATAPDQAGAPGAGPSTPRAGGSAGAQGSQRAPSAPAPRAQPAAVPHADRAEGVSDDTILLGIAYATSGSEANEAIGGGAATSTDTKRATELLIADINGRGGIHGRLIEPVWHEIDALSGRTDAQFGQEMCARWTEDNHVFAALGAPYEPLLECMNEAGAPLMYTSLSGSSAERFERYPLYFEAGNLNLSRISIVTVDALARRDFFAAEAQIGIVTYDDRPAREAVENALIPALARHGLEPAEIEYVPPPQSTTDISGMSAALSGAVLRFNASGIDHVLILDYNALISFLFMQEAEAQGYRPRYGLNTQNGNSALSDLLADSGSQGQLIDSLSIGWAPSLDTHEPDDPHNASAERARCLQLMRDGGLTAFDSRNAMGQALITCEEMWFFEAAANAAGPSLTTGTFIAGAEARGAWESPLTLGNRIAPGKHDGVDQVADMAFFEDCACFRYTAEPYEIP